MRDFILFMDVNFVMVEDGMYWLNEEEDNKLLPPTARSFLYVHQSDPSNPFLKEYRLGEVKPSILGYSQIASAEQREKQGISFEEAYRSSKIDESPADDLLPLNEGMSVWVEDGKPHFARINANTELVSSVEQLQERLNQILQSQKQHKM